MYEIMFSLIKPIVWCQAKKSTKHLKKNKYLKNAYFALVNFHLLLLNNKAEKNG